jgi:ssDNA-binding Zn-finger/Zn-ribbon topoisomerase 1
MTDLKNKRLSLKCPDCETGEQIIRQNSGSGHYFIACTAWPECKWTAELPESLRMRLEGQPGLFNFDEVSE